MPELLSAELVDLRDRVAAVAAEVHADPPGPAAVRAASKAAGIFGLTQRSEPSAVALVVVRETLASADVIHLKGWFGPSPGVLDGVGEPLRTTHLMPLLEGDRQAGFGFTEPPDATRPTWAAIDGDELVVNGAKSYVTGGADADFINALVEVDGFGPAMVVIDTDTPGVTLLRRFGSIDGSHHAAFDFTDVRVPATNLIGVAGGGTSRALGQINQVRMAIAATCVGLALHVVGFVSDHLATPGRGGAPRASSERARLGYGDLRVRTYAARSVLYRTARLVDAAATVSPIGSPVGSAGEAASSGAASDTINEVMAAKVIATETVGEVVDRAIQLVGGEALIEGHPLESIYRRVRSLRLAEGESDLLRSNVARGALDLGKGRM